MTTVEQVYAVLLRHYKHDRFEGRGLESAQASAASALDQLNATGTAFISRHEAANGVCMIFDERLHPVRSESVRYAPATGRFVLPVTL